MFLTCVARRRNSRPSPWRGSRQSRRWGGASTHVRFMFPAEASSTALPPAAPKYHTPSTSKCSASTCASVSVAPVTMLITPAGRSDVSSTLYRSVAESGAGSDGTTTTVFPVATSGATRETKPSSGWSAGQATPTTPIGSFIARVTPRTGVWCTAPSHLSARSEEHTSELQSRGHLVCRLLLEKKKKKINHIRANKKKNNTHHPINV